MQHNSRRSMREFTVFLMECLALERELDREKDDLFQKGVNIEAPSFWKSQVDIRGLASGVSAT